MKERMLHIGSKHALSWIVGIGKIWKLWHNRFIVLALSETHRLMNELEMIAQEEVVRPSW